MKLFKNMKIYGGFKGLSKRVSSVAFAIVFGANVAATVLPEVAHAETESETKIEYRIDNKDLERSLPGEFGENVYSVKVDDNCFIPCVAYTATENDTLTGMSVKACNYWKDKANKLGDSSIVDEISAIKKDKRSSQFWIVIAYLNNCSPESIGAGKVYLIPSHFRDAEGLLGDLREQGWTINYIRKYNVYEIVLDPYSSFGEGTLGDTIIKMYCDMYGLDSFDNNLVMEYLKFKYNAGEINTLNPYSNFDDLSNEEKFWFGENIPFLDVLEENAQKNDGHAYTR